MDSCEGSKTLYKISFKSVKLTIPQKPVQDFIQSFRPLGFLFHVYLLSSYMCLCN